MPMPTCEPKLQLGGRIVEPADLVTVATDVPLAAVGFDVVVLVPVKEAIEPVESRVVAGVGAKLGVVRVIDVIDDWHAVVAFAETIEIVAPGM